MDSATVIELLSVRTRSLTKLKISGLDMYGGVTVYLSGVPPQTKLFISHV